MIFYSKFDVIVNKSRYDCLKAFLSDFNDLNNFTDDPRAYFGVCDDGLFSFKTHSPNSPIYAYSPKFKLKFYEAVDGTKINVKSSATLLLVAFIVCVLFAVMFALVALLFSNVRLVIATAIFLALAVLFALLSAKANVKLKKQLSSL